MILIVGLIAVDRVQAFQKKLDLYEDHVTDSPSPESNQADDDSFEGTDWGIRPDPPDFNFFDNNGNETDEAGDDKPKVKEIKRA